MPTFVLVHGAWHGSWYWCGVTRLLRARGHKVFAPTLCGLGDRAGELSQRVDLSRHVGDIVDLYRLHRLTDTVLVGHSYGGMVVTDAAGVLADRIGALAYIDAFLPYQGLPALAMQPEVRARDILNGARQHGDGWKIPPRPAAAWRLEPELCAEFDANAGFHPLATLTEPPRTSAADLDVAAKLYIEATGTGPGPFGACAAWTRGHDDWTTLTIDTHHFPMLSAPEAIARMLEEHAASAHARTPASDNVTPMRGHRVCPPSAANMFSLHKGRNL